MPEGSLTLLSIKEPYFRSEPVKSIEARLLIVVLSPFMQIMVKGTFLAEVVSPSSLALPASSHYGLSGKFRHLLFRSISGFFFWYLSIVPFRLKVLFHAFAAELISASTLSVSNTIFHR